MTETNDLPENAFEDIAPEKRTKTSDFSKAAVLFPVTFKTNEVQILFERYYSHTDKALYALTKAARGQGRVADAVTSEAKLSEVFESFSRELAQAVATLQKTVEEKIPEDNRKVLYDHERKFKAPARTGFGKRLLNVTSVLDTLVSMVNTLEINAVMTMAEASEVSSSWCNRYKAFCVAIQRLRSVPKSE